MPEHLYRKQVHVFAAFLNMSSAAGVSITSQSLSLESSRWVSKPFAGSIVSMLSSSFVGDVSQLAIPSSFSLQAARSSLAIGARTDARMYKDVSSDIEFACCGDKLKSLQTQSQRAAVANADYMVTESDADYMGFRSERKGFHDNDNIQNFSSDIGRNSTWEVSSSQSTGLSVSQLGLKQELVDALSKRGITNLFPIQEAVLKPALDGNDIIGRARTGTGKTLAFGIPVIHRLLEQNESDRFRHFRFPRMLVLAPTRELAMQVENELMESAPNLSTLCVYGGVSITTQQRKLQRGVDIVVGTPGRVIDLLERRSLQLADVRYLVLDEADQMLAVGFEEDVERILEQLPAERQSMLFSATMPSWVSKLSRKYLKNPMTIDLVGDSDEKLAEGIKILSITTPLEAKRSILSDLITVYGKGGKTIVFTQTKKDADDVALSMNRMLGTEALHGDISQAQREKTLNSFRNGKFSVLVATDVAARGLDIPNVDLIIHFEIPNDPETFVHRSGRTGRAGKEGVAILMHTDSQMRTVRNIERDVGCKFQVITPPSADEVLRSSSEYARDALRKVHPDLRAVFLPTAQMLLQEEGVNALAAAIAHLSGFTEPPASRSLITYEQGKMTLQLTRSQNWVGGTLSPRNIMGALGSIYPKAADEIGKIIMLDDREGTGAVFDLPEDIAKELLEVQTPPEYSIVAISKLPRLRYDDEPRDRYGRFNQRGGGYRRSEWSPRSRLSDRSFGMDRDSRWGRRDLFSGSWNDNRSRGSRRQDSPDGWGSRQGDAGSYGRTSFSPQGCFICGEPGHRAAVCPSKTQGSYM